MARFEILKEKQIRRLVIADIPTSLADWLDYIIIIALFSHVWQSAPWLLAAAPLALAIPRIVIGPLAGVILDKIDSRMVLVFANFARALSMVCLMFFPSMTWVLLILIFRGLADAFIIPARLAAVQALAKPEQLQTTNALIYGFGQLMRVATPFVAGILILNMTPHWVLGASAGISLAASLLFFQVNFPAKAATNALSMAGFIPEILAGIFEIIKNPRLLQAIMFMAAASIGMALYGRTIILLAVDFGLSVDLSRINFVTLGIGGSLGALALLLFSSKTKFMLIMGLGAMFSGALVIALGLFSRGDIALALNLLFLAIGGVSAFSSWIYIAYRSTIQLEVSKDKVGRVAALGEAVFTLAILAGVMLSGKLLDQFDVGTAFAIGGMFMVFIGIIGAVASPKKSE